MGADFGGAHAIKINAALGPGLDRKSSSPCSLKTLPGDDTRRRPAMRSTLSCAFEILGFFRNRRGDLRLLVFSPCGSTLQLICGEQWRPPCSGRACTRSCYPSERPEMGLKSVPGSEAPNWRWSQPNRCASAVHHSPSQLIAELRATLADEQPSGATKARGTLLGLVLPLFSSLSSSA